VTGSRLRASRWSLRRRVLVAVLALLALVATVIAVLGVASVNRVLTQRLDSQLTTAVARAERAADRIPDGDGGRGPAGGPGGRVPVFLAIPGQPVDTFAALVVDGEIQRAGVLDESGVAQPVDAADAAVLADVPVDGTVTTVDLGPELGDYRVVAVPGAGDRVIVTGLSLEGVQETVARLARAMALIAIVGLTLVAVAGAVLLRRALQPLDRIAATASRVAELPLDTGEVVLRDRVPEEDTDPGTEVGQVGAALNRLLGHVASALNAREASERQVRQFVADASHELRTPLAAIRGYAELTRRVPEPVPADVAYALSRVESEATRMSGLVEDLLLLARLDSEGGLPSLRAENVDLSRLLVDAVSDARAAGPDHRWELTLPPEPLIVRGDPGRLHQVVANLLSNARVHTPAGTAVTAALRPAVVHGVEGVRLTVSDEGPGIPADLLPHVFERFRRGDTSRSRTAGSSGLGLAIVAAVVHAHGGRVGASSVPGRTELVVELPVRGAASAPDPAGAAPGGSGLASGG
jgi:two-component system OmpR family sensor kinase